MSQRPRYRSVVADSARWDGFRFRPGDIVISTPPKCGTTWMQRLVALLLFDGEPPGPISSISPWLDMQLATTDDVFALLETQQHRRFIKSHTPFDGIPYDERVTYVCVGRDPRDVAVSSLHHMDNMDVERFIEKRAAAVGLDDLAELGVDQPGPPPPQSEADRMRAWMDGDSEVTVMTLASVLRHLESFWTRRHLPNVALFHYDDLLVDLPGQMRRLADVLDVTISDERLAQLAAAATFDAMRQRADDVVPNADIQLWHSTTAFFHRGTSGQWREAFTDDDLRHYDARVQELVPPDLAAWVHNGWLRTAAAAD